MAGLGLRYDFGASDLVGARMVDLSLATEDGLTTVSTLLRSGRGLLLELGGPPSTRCRRQMASTASSHV